MTQQALAQMLVRAAGLLIAVLAVLNAPYEAANMLRGHKEPLRYAWTAAEKFEFWGTVVGPALISIIIGLAIFRFADAIAGRGLARPGAEAAGPPVEAPLLERVAIMAVGFYLFGDGLAFAVRDVAGMALTQYLEYDFAVVPDSMKLNLLGDAARAAGGLALLLQAERLAGLRRKLVAPRPE